MVVMGARANVSRNEGMARSSDPYGVPYPYFSITLAASGPFMKARNALAASLSAPLRSASRARSMASITSSTVLGSIAPSFSSAAAIEPGVG
jgi:hypothetical protein